MSSQPTAATLGEELALPFIFHVITLLSFPNARSTFSWDMGSRRRI